MKRTMWVVMGVLAIIVGYLTFTSPQWTTISLVHPFLG